MILNNPYTRAMLIGRLQNQREAINSRGLMATLAAQQEMQHAR
jgi:hypothetical protein